LSEITQLAQPRISNHLKILREENLIQERRTGSWRHYRVDHRQHPAGLESLWVPLREAWDSRDQFAADDKRLSAVLDARTRLGGAGNFFDQIAHRWDDLRNSLFGDAIGRAVLRAFLPPNLVVADVGTGTGYVLELFALRAARFIAVDHSEAMLAVARAKAAAAGYHHVEFRHADIQEHSPLAANEADVLTLIQVLHHLQAPDAALARLAPALRPGGLVIVSDFLEHQETWLESEMQHRWLGFSRARVTSWFPASQWEPVLWEVMPGRTIPAEDGAQPLSIPDGFLAVFRRLK
jgi:ubiquinone/menaquinone biosynthesis C-methylase UbiE